MSQNIPITILDLTNYPLDLLDLTFLFILRRNKIPTEYF